MRRQPKKLEAPIVSCRSPVALVFATMAQTVGWAKARARGLSAHEVADTRRAHASLPLACCTNAWARRTPGFSTCKCCACAFAHPTTSFNPVDDTAPPAGSMTRADNQRAHAASESRPRPDTV